MSRDHRKLRAFELVDELVIELYKATVQFPREERFGLTSQMRRAAVSSAANIVEGCAREGEKEYLHFLNIAFGSLREVGYFLSLSARLSYLVPEEFQRLDSMYEEAASVLAGLIRARKRTN